MDLLCKESIVTHPKQLSNRYTKKTPITKPYCIGSTLPCSPPPSSAAANIRASRDIVCMYVIASVASPVGATKSTKHLQQSQSVNYQSPQQHYRHTINLTPCAAATSATEGATTADKHFEYGNAHMVVTDPNFKTDRCLENALKSEEKHQHITETYFKTVQKDITPAMRKIVAEWMMEVCAAEKCQDEVVLLALNYMDRFLSTKSVRKTHLQILAAACLLLASKLREPSCRALSAELLVFYTDNSIYKDDLIKWELYVLSRLGWDLSSVTPLDFLELLIIRLPISSKHFSDLNIDKVRQHAQAFISLAAKEHRFSKYTPSTIAASSIAASISGLNWHLCAEHNIHFLLSLLTDLTSVGQDQLQQCMILMEAIFEEHSRKLQPREKPELLNGYYNGRYEHEQYHQRHQTPIVSAMPNLSQTCKMQAQSQKELHEIKS